MALNISDFMIGLYLLSIAITDIVIGDNYVGSNFIWRGSVPCHVLGFMSLLAIIMSTLFMLAVSISRYRVVKSPLTSKEVSVIIPYALLCTILFVILIVL